MTNSNTFNRQLHIYLAAPYRGSKEVIDARMDIVAKIAARIRVIGGYVTTPLFHHWTFQEVDNGDGAYWEDYSEHLLTTLALSRGLGSKVELWIIDIDGWKESKGIMREVEVAERYGIEVIHIHPELSPNGSIQFKSRSSHI